MQSNLPPLNVDETKHNDDHAVVDAKWIVADLLSTWPQAAPVFLRYKMYCVGCSMAAFETLGDALHIYGLPEKPFLTEINTAIAASIQT